MPINLPSGARKRAREAETQIEEDPYPPSAQRAYFYLDGFDENPDGTYTITFEITDVRTMMAFLYSRSPNFEYFEGRSFIATYEDMSEAELIALLNPPPVMNWKGNYIEGSWYTGIVSFTDYQKNHSRNYTVHINDFFKNDNFIEYEVLTHNISLIAFPGPANLDRRSSQTVYYIIPKFEGLRTFQRIPSYFGFDVYNTKSQFLLAAFPESSPISETVGLDDPQNLEAAETITSVGILDVGTAGCNLLIAGDKPVCYYDFGFPLPKYNKSAPAYLTGSGAQKLPIRGLPIILSHWDWDHWSLILQARAMDNTFVTGKWRIGPRIPHSQTAAAEKKKLAQAGLLEILIGSKPLPNITNLTVVTTFTARVSSGFANNNNGLAIAINDITLGNHSGYVVLTADANYNSAQLATAIQNQIIGFSAVHHGSNNDGAADNLPVPTGYNPMSKVWNANFNGRIAYSYGMINVGKNKAWKRPYFFPVAAAITKYHTARWGTAAPANQMSTSEGPNLDNTPVPTSPTQQPPRRGNIRMGDQTQLNAAYSLSAFYVYPNPLT